MNWKRFLVVNKWRMQLGYQNVGILGIGFLVAERLQDVMSRVGFNLQLYVYFLLGILGLWISGYIIDRLGFYSTEIDYVSERNPYFEKHLRGKKGKV